MLLNEVKRIVRVLVSRPMRLVPRHILPGYFKYRAELRGFDLSLIEKIVRYSEERYLDTETSRLIVIGEHDKKLVMIPYEETHNAITPITIHPTSRQQIKFRLNTGRFTYE